MNKSRKFLPALTAVGLALAVSLSLAEPVSLTVSAATFTPGAGYGDDVKNGNNDESGGTLLHVVFDNSVFTANNLSFADLGSIQSIDLGTINFLEPNTGNGNGNGNLGIRTDETDFLDVVVNMTLSLPTPMQLALTAMVTAATGRIDDDAVDYALSWTPLVVDFGEGGSFRLALNPLSFANVGTQTLTATVTLLTAPREPAPGPTPAAAVPEPASLALAAIALAGAGLARRRRRG